MSGGIFDDEAERFARELDDAEQWHLEWTRRVLRCAVLRTTPGDDVLADDAHRHCPLGRWLQERGKRLVQLDAATSKGLQENHQRMHDAARRLCQRILETVAVEPTDLEDFERAEAGVIADLALLKAAHLANSVRLDALTGLRLRYGLEEEFQRCRSQALRHGEKVVVLMLDLDCFKDINDAQGHAVGDLALQHVAALLRSHCRAGEPVFRFGGEEFLALLQAADHATAQHAVERLLQALRDTPLRLADGSALVVRASAGLAEVGATEPMVDAVARADHALYAAKAGGRDTWRWAPAAHPPACCVY